MNLTEKVGLGTMILMSIGLASGNEAVVIVSWVLMIVGFVMFLLGHWTN